MSLERQTVDPPAGGSAGPQVARMLGAAMAQLPASLVLAAVAVLAFGLLPRVTVAGAWTAVGLVRGPPWAGWW